MPGSAVVPARVPSATGENHWIAAAARRAGLPGVDALNLRADASAAQSWETASRVLGKPIPELVSFLADHLGLRVADFREADRQAKRLVSERLAKRHGVLPLRDNDRVIVVATSNPVDLAAEQDLEFSSGRRVEFELAAPADIDAAIAAAYSPERAVESLLEAAPNGAADDVRIIVDETPEEITGRDIDTGPVVRLTNHIIANAVRQGASDIHFEPGPRSAAIRFRVDGVLRHYMEVPLAVLNRVVSRIKVLARLDIADRMRPQDGRTRVQVDALAIDLRVSTVPTRDSEKAVIRLLRSDTARSLEEVGIGDAELASIRALIGHRDGIVIVTGPTGSGKTTTMYAAIREIADGTVNVMTVEDPIEYELAGVTQMQVEPKRNVTFASALRAILRQDPDIIFVGEIRDLETAEVAVQASLTGHLVLATLHTNDAFGAVSRLADFGIDRASLADTLRGAIAQRLVRRVCAACVTPIADDPTPKERQLADRFGVSPIVRATGCDACGMTGYRGRMPIDEVVTLTPALRELIAANAPTQALQRAAAAAGMHTLREAGLALVASGSTTLEEIDRVIGDSGADVATIAVRSAERTSIRQTVLVVDDDPVQLLVAEAVLTESGYEVLGANNGEVALEILALRPDTSLVLTDLDMPRMGGATLLSRIRRHDTLSSIPIIVITGSSDAENEVALMDDGADDYLRKPVDPIRLATRVRAALRRTHADTHQ